MTKTIILGVKGQISVKCIVASGNFITKNTGHAQTTGKMDRSELFKNAILDCIYQHMRLGGKSSPQVQVLDYDMKYLGENQLIKVKRRGVKVKAQRIRKNNKYITQTFYLDEKDKKQILSERKWNKNDINKINKKKSKTYVQEVKDIRSNKIIDVKKWKIERNINKFV